MSALIEEVKTYIEDHFTTEMQEELNRSRLLFEVFDYQPAYEGFSDILFDPMLTDPDFVHQRFLAEFHRILTSLVNLHEISLTEDATIEQMNKLLSGLYQIQFVEDPVPVIRILETDLDEIEKLAIVMDLHNHLDKMETYSIVDVVSENLLIRLRERMEAREETIEDETEIESAEDRIQLQNFFEALGKENLGFMVLENEFKAGYPFEVYWPYVQDNVRREDVKTLALDLFSLFAVSGGARKNPIEFYRNHSDLFSSDLKEVVAIETEITRLMGVLKNYIGAKNDARSFSSPVHPQ